MTDRNYPPPAIRFLLIAAALVVIVWGINQAESVLSLILVSVFLAVLGTPPVLWLEKKRFPCVLAVLIVMAGMVTILLLVGVIVASSLNSFSHAAPYYQMRIHEQIASIEGFLTTKGVKIADTPLLGMINPGAVVSMATGFMSGLGSVLSSTVLILFTVAFILLEASSFPVKLRNILGDPERAFPQFTKFVDDIRRYMIIKTLISLTAGISIWAWLTMIGVEFPILWGFLAFLLHFVPTIGGAISAVPAVLLAFIQLGAAEAGMAAAGYLVVGAVLGNVVEPRLLGRRLGLSTLVVFLSMIFWGSLLGVIGVVLCIPFTMTLKFAAEGSESTRWITVLLGPEKCLVPFEPKHRTGWAKRP